MRKTESIKSLLEQAIIKADPTREFRDVNCDHDDPWRICMFDLARAVLGINELRDLFLNVWRDQVKPDQAQWRKIRFIVRSWERYWKEYGYDCSDIPKELRTDEFLRCLWRASMPDLKAVKGQSWEYVTQEAETAFMENMYGGRAGAIIKALDLHEAYVKLIVHLFAQCAKLYKDDPFPAPQRKIADWLQGYLGGCRDGKITSIRVMRIMKYLRYHGALDLVEKAIPHRRAALYQLHDPTG